MGGEEVGVRRGGWRERGVVIGGIGGIGEIGTEETGTEGTGAGVLAVVRRRGDGGMIVTGTEEGITSDGVVAAVIIGTGLRVVGIAAGMVPVEETSGGGRFGG